MGDREMKPAAARSCTVLIVLIFALGSWPALAGQEVQDIVSVSSVLSRDAVRPGETFKAAVILKVRPGFHINDSAPLDEFLYPTALTFEAADGLEVLETFYPAGRRAKYDYSEVEVAVYEGQVFLGVLLKAADGLAPGTVKLKGTLGYQACDDSTCLPPTEIGFEVAVPVVRASQKTVETYPEIFEKIAFRSPLR
ncbi:MAG: hypothetical protein FJY79_09985 [Candidatus Aminicenantes bacterium]|nr:hypothetical protein [Candidatus Aminicenantes bacterium]